MNAKNRIRRIRKNLREKSLLLEEKCGDDVLGGKRPGTTGPPSQRETQRRPCGGEWKKKVRGLKRVRVVSKVFLEWDGEREKEKNGSKGIVKQTHRGGSIGGAGGAKGIGIVGGGAKNGGGKRN